MKRPYIIGLIVSVAIAVASTATKGAVTKYPGLGDFFLFDVLPSFAQEKGWAALFAAKSVAVAVLFSLLFAVFRGNASKRSILSTLTSSLASIAMSLGEAVVG